MIGWSVCGCLRFFQLGNDDEKGGPCPSGEECLHGVGKAGIEVRIYSQVSGTRIYLFCVTILY
eukprot:COSAG06_NODE_2362_length_7003_cov_15.069815_5_plen_63_part_00